MSTPKLCRTKRKHGDSENGSTANKRRSLAPSVQETIVNISSESSSLTVLHCPSSPYDGVPLEKQERICFSGLKKGDTIHEPSKFKVFVEDDWMARGREVRDLQRSAHHTQELYNIVADLKNGVDASKFEIVSFPSDHPLHGQRGLRAKVQLTKWTIVGIYNGHKLSLANLNAQNLRISQQQFQASYLLNSSDQTYVVDPTVQIDNNGVGNATVLINDCRLNPLSPEAKSRSWALTDEEKLRLNAVFVECCVFNSQDDIPRWVPYVVLNREVEVTEDILLDYGATYWLFDFEQCKKE
jgi:hypothetical protein